MAERRMFSQKIIDSDAFLDMGVSTRLLYYDLSMRADDDGVVNSPKKVMKITGASPDDLNVLAARKFIIPFDNGVIVIKHWRIHNLIRKDTYRPTTYKEQLDMLELDENNAYRLKPVTDSLQFRNGLVAESLRTRYETVTQDSIGKDSIDKVSIDKDSISTTTTESAGAGAPTREDSTQLEEAKPNEYEVAEFFRSEYCMTTKEAKCQAKAFIAYNNSRGWRFADWKEAADIWASRIREEEQ